MILMILALLLPFKASAQEQNPFYNFDFTGGLNTYNSPLILQNNESPDLQNVLGDQTGSLDKRRGYIKLTSTQIGDAAHDVNRIFYFPNTSGTNYCLGFSGSTGTFSTDGCQTFTIFVSTLTAGNDVNCDAMNNSAFCVNGQYSFQFTGASNSTINMTAFPAGVNMIRKFNNQCFVAGETANLSRLRYSNVNDCTTGYGSTQFIDINPNDGDQITGIGYAIYGGLPIYKKYSTWYLTQVGSNGNGPVFQIVNISPNIGAKNFRSIKNFLQEQLFDSVGVDGGQPGIYAFDGIKVYEKTKKLRNSFDKIDTFTSSQGQISFNTEGQFAAGNLCVAGAQSCLTATQNPGFLQPATTTFADTVTSFPNGTMVNLTTTSANTIGLVEPSFQTFINASGVLTNSTNWTISGSPAWNALNPCQPSGFGTFSSNPCWNINSGSLASPPTVVLNILDVNNNTLYTTSVNGTQFTFSVPLPSSLSQNVNTIKLKISIGSSIMQSASFIRGNSIQITGQVFNPGFGDNPGTSLLIEGDPNGGFGSLQFITTGTYKSPVFDTGFSLPVYGPFQSNLSSSSVSQVAFSSCSGATSTSVGNCVSQTNGSVFAPSVNEFIQYFSTFTVNSATNTTAAVTSNTIISATTGTWQSAETFTSNKMSSNGWGKFITIQNVDPAASIAYAVRVSTYQGGTAFAPTVPVTPGNTITASTGAYVVVIATETVASSTETAQVSDITLFWTQGSNAASPDSNVFGNRYHYACQSQGGSWNDTVYVLDSNGSWWRWNDMNARSLEVVNQNFVMGGAAVSSTTASSTGYGNIFQLYQSDSDNGMPINAYYNTKDFPLTDLSHTKSVERAIVSYGSNPNNFSLDLIRDTNQEDFNYTINASTGALFGVNFKPTLNASGGTITGNTFRLKFSNNAAQAPFEILGYGMQFKDLGIMQPN